jgi:anti-sigma B factor antagonist
MIGGLPPSGCGKDGREKHRYNRAMHAGVRHADDVVIVDFRGDLVEEDGEVLLRQVVDELLSEGWRKILINLAKVKRLDSAGVGELVASWKLAAEFGASIKLLRPGDRVRSTLHLSQILPLLEVFEDEPTAVRSFAS